MQKAILDVLETMQTALSDLCLDADWGEPMEEKAIRDAFNRMDALIEMCQRPRDFPLADRELLAQAVFHDVIGPQDMFEAMATHQLHPRESINGVGQFRRLARHLDLISFQPAPEQTLDAPAR